MYHSLGGELHENLNDFSLVYISAVVNKKLFKKRKKKARENCKNEL